MTKVAPTNISPPPRVKLLKGNGVDFVQPDGAGYRPCVDFIRANPARSLSLWLTPSLPLPSLRGIDGIQEIKQITCWRKHDDVQLLESLGGLEGLTLAEAQAFDFANLPALRRVGGVWSPHWINLESCQSLERFHVSAYKRPDLRDLAVHEKLRAITLISTGIRTADGLGEHPDLTHVEINRGAGLMDLSGLKCAKAIEDLRLESCRKLSSYGSLGDLSHLSRLELNKCGPIPSIDFISRLSRLRILSFQNTELVNKDLAPCMEHPTLAYIYATDGGYTPPLREVEEAARLRSIGANG